MNPISMRPTPPATAATAATAPDTSAAPGFAALLDAAREPATPAEPAMPAEGDAPEADSTDRPGERTAKAPRKPHAPLAKGRREDSRVEPPVTLDVAALLPAKAAPGGAAELAADGAAAEPPVSPAADAAAAPLPNLLPLPSVAAKQAVAEAAAEGTPRDRAAAAPARVGPESLPGTDPLLPAALEAPQATPARVTTPALDATPASPTTSDAAHHAPAPGLIEATPSAIGLAAPQTPNPTPIAVATAAAPFTAHLAAALESPAFAPALATQVRWLVEGGVQTAQLTLNPPELGPVAVRIAVEGTQARVDFTAEFAPTRSAIEAGLPTLAATLADGGLTLAGGGVFDGSSPRQPQEDGRGASRRQPFAASGGSGDTPSLASAQPLRSRGLVDLVA